MSSIGIRTEADREKAINLINSWALPFSIALKKGVPRSLSQNKLQRKWMLELQEQGDQTAEEYRAYCKLHFGIPILRAESDEFKEKYDRLIRPLDYEVKLEYMKVPFDFPVTRIMTTKQKAEYLDAIFTFWSYKGFRLTEPKKG